MGDSSPSAMPRKRAPLAMHAIGANGGMTMTMRRRPPRPAIAMLAVATTVSGTLAWRDLNRRSPGQVRGSKRLWRILLTLNPGNSALYWLLGRRR